MAERRKKYLVQRFQYKLVGRVLTYWSLYHIALAILGLLPLGMIRRRRHR
jgi:hypothetical protein